MLILLCSINVFQIYFQCGEHLMKEKRKTHFTNINKFDRNTSVYLLKKTVVVCRYRYEIFIPKFCIING